MHSTLNNKSLFLKNEEYKASAFCYDNKEIKLIFVSCTPEINSGSQQNSVGKKTDERKWKGPGELFRTLGRGDRRDDLNGTEQMETTAHEWKESEISFHAGVRGSSKDWWGSIILAVSSANRYFGKVR